MPANVIWRHKKDPSAADRANWMRDTKLAWVIENKVNIRTLNGA